MSEFDPPQGRKERERVEKAQLVIQAMIKPVEPQKIPEEHGFNSNGDYV
jgi:hypothetical protein